MSDKPKGLDDIDEFWNLNSLMPQKRTALPTHRAPNTNTVEITLPGDSERTGTVPIPARDAAHSVPVHLKGRGDAPLRTRLEQYRSHPLDPYLIYSPSGQLIKRVEVSKWDTKFNFYENFRTDAVRLWNRNAVPCEHTPFFSYVPQYSQLKHTQLKWYLWWRENVRGGVYLPCDFCYILLYIYEIINCPDLLTPERGLTLLCDVWLAYRSQHRRIDSYMVEWLCDYCLINKLECPTYRLEPILGEIVGAATLKEFYIDVGNSSAAAGMLSQMSTYDWRSSRYVTEDNIQVFSHHIKAAFDKVWREVISKNDTGSVKELRVERTAYEGALCVYDMKRTVAVEYASYTRSPKFRFVATDIIKYSENRVRMALGIKARLKVTELNGEICACIDEYFDRYLPVQKKARVRKALYDTPEVNEYDKLYEPVTADFSLENAIKIEKSSWITTEKLVSAFEECEEEPVPIPEPIQPDPIQAVSHEAGDEFAVLVNSLDTASLEALTALSNGYTSLFTSVCAKYGMLADALADKINETAFDIIGDCILEPDGGTYRLIADYEGDIKKWLI